MKKLSLIAILGLGLSIAQVDAAIVKVKVTDKVGDKVVLTFDNKEKKEITIDANGNGTIELNDFKPQYVLMQYDRGRRTLFLDPQKDLSISFEGKTMWKSIAFEGPGAQVNTYLNNGNLKALAFNDAGLEEAAYLQKSDSMYNANLEFMQAAKLPADFVKLEKERLKYFSYAGFPLFPVYHPYVTKKEEFKASASYYNRLKELTALDANLLSLSEYKEFLTNAVSSLGLNGEKAEASDKLVKSQLQYINANVTDPVLKEYLTNFSVVNYVKSNGVDDAEFAIVAFNQNVKNADLVEAFGKLCDQWRKIAAGQPSPEFKGEDMEGKVVSLADLKGKFVYIDIWATWCGPCRGEIPHLKKLEEKYQGKDIEFVSLSCDQDKEAWKKMVAKEELKGVQLHIGSKASFMEEYMVSGIPRFILLDKEGKVLSAKMTRPSNAETVQKFDELLGL